MDEDLKREALATVEEHMAEALRRGIRSGHTLVELDPQGDGILLVRSATLERPDQLTGQIHQLLAAADKGVRRPKLIVACAGVSGAKPLERRPDLLAVLEALDRERCRWVAVAGTDRIARSITTTHRFLEELRQRRASLFLGSSDKSVFDDELTVKLLFSLFESAADRARVFDRMRHIHERRRTCQ
jgi:DNA invertase Pin-like site-specific DNA recombinase